jgi:hypothetical protein
MTANQPSEVPTERDRVAGRLVAVALASTIVAIIASVFVVWLLATRVSHGGGRSNTVDLALEPPADPFDHTTQHENLRLERLHALDTWAWLDASHTRVRMPITVAIDRYLAGDSQ